MLDAARQGALPAGAVAVTFDDGYADNLANAAPLLVEFGVPATMFLSTGAIVNGCEFWWDDLERIDTRRPQGSGARAPRHTHRPLVAEEVAALASMPGITIGSHTVNHPSLAALPPEAQYHEIAQARETLEALIARPVEFFAYPFGGKDDVSADTISAARRAGVTIACTTIGGPVTCATDPMQVPRAVVRDWSADEFARRFARWTGVPAR
jgi:peptidoglycan/xylan/chitin deacetylase (PgdA/CDA1 family)